MDKIQVCRLDQDADFSIRADAASDPSSYSFPVVAVNEGKTDHKIFTITNAADVAHGPAALNAAAIHLSGAAATDYRIYRKPRAYPLLLAAGDSFEVEVLFDPHASGTRNAQLVIDSTYSQDTLSVPLSTLAEPPLGLLCKTVDFESFNEGDVLNSTTGLDLDLFGTPVTAYMTAGNQVSGELFGDSELRVVNLTNSGCVDDYCGEISGELAVEADNATVPDFYYFTFSTPIAYLSARFVNVSAGGYYYMRARGVDDHGVTVTRTTSKSCTSGQSGCNAGEWFTLVGEDADVTGDIVESIRTWHTADPSATVRMDHVRVCRLDDNAPKVSNPVIDTGVTSYVFPTIAINEQATPIHTFSVTNTANETLFAPDLVINSIYLYNSHSSHFRIDRMPSTFPVNLPAGEAITIDAYFDPTSAGSRSTQLRFAISGQSDHIVTLSGTAESSRGVLCAQVDFESGFAANSFINSSADLNFNISGTIVGVRVSSGYAADNVNGDEEAQVIWTGDTGCSTDYCNEIAGEYFITPTESQTQAGERNLYLSFSQQVAVVAADVIDFDTPSQSMTLRATGTQRSGRTVAESTDSLSCGNSYFGCQDFEFDMLRAQDMYNIGDFAHSARFDNHATGSVYIDNLRPCILQEFALPTLYAEADVNPVSHDYGVWAINRGPSAIQTFTIANVGNLTDDAPALVIQNIALVGSEASHWVISRKPRTFPVTLAPGHSITVNVYFDPHLEGSRSAWLRVSTNDQDLPTWDVPLVGECEPAWGVVCVNIDFETGYTPGDNLTLTTVDIGGIDVNVTFSSGAL